MRITSRVVWTVLANLAVALPAPAAVLDVPVVPLVVRIYDAPALPADRGAEALREAREILAEAGFAPEWIACRMTAPQARCKAPLAGAELVVRVAAAPLQPPVTGPLPLGYSLVDLHTGRGALATIYLDRVRWLAFTARASFGALLGRAITHEIGHLLLGSPHHGERGVMRAIWSPDSVRRNGGGLWRFTTAEARQMREAVSTRTPQQY
jgi:hypothetical protein